MRELKETAFKRIECVNQMKKEPLITVKRLLVIAIANAQARTSSGKMPHLLIELLLTPTLSTANLKTDLGQFYGKPKRRTTRAKMTHLVFADTKSDFLSMISDH